MIALTYHAIERGKERLGLKEAALRSTAQKAFDDGLQTKDCAGRLRRWLKLQQSAHHRNNLRVHADHLFIFEGIVLITILHLPANLHRSAHDAKLKRVKREE